MVRLDLPKFEELNRPDMSNEICQGQKDFGVTEGSGANLPFAALQIHSERDFGDSNRSMPEVLATLSVKSYE